MMAMDTHIWLPPIPLALLITLLPIAAPDSCYFPDELQTETYDWLYGHEGTNGEVYFVKIDQSMMTFNSDSEFYQLRCNQQINYDTYLVVDLRRNQKTFCLKIIERSPTVFQFKRSTPTRVMTASSCSEQNMRFDKWILVKNSANNKEPFPLDGGFYVNSIRKGNTRYCAGEWVMPRMESQCTQHGRVFLDFQDCSQNTFLPGMDRRQLLFSIGAWQDENTMYAILKHNINNRFWTITYPADQVDNKRITLELLTGARMSDNGGSEGLSLGLSREIISDICTDYAPDCPARQARSNICAEMEGHLYCKKTCGFCGAPGDGCRFEPSLQGHWRFYRPSGEIEPLEILPSKIKTDFLPTDRCVKEDYYKNHIYSQVKYYDNGCSPRFYCFEMENNKHKDLSSKRQEMFTIKIQNGAVWPHYEDSYYCNPRTTYGDPWRPSVWNIALRDEEPQAVPCDLPYVAFDLEITNKDDRQCRGQLVQNSCSPSSTSFNIKSQDCEEDIVDISVKYTCIAVSTDNVLSFQNYIFITQSSISHDPQCFIFSDDMSEGVLLDIGSCHVTLFDEVGLARFRAKHLNRTCAEQKAVASNFAIIHHMSSLLTMFVAVVVFASL